MINFIYRGDTVNVNVEFSNEVNADEFMDQVRTFMLAVGYALSTVETAFLAMAEEIEGDRG